MIKIYKSNNHWIGECTSLNIMVVGDTPVGAIEKLCVLLRDFLLKSYRKGKLEKILEDQE